MPASSPLLSGERPSAPNLGGWRRSNINIRLAKTWKLVPADSPLNDNFSYNVTYHHNIPWADLRDSWNIVFTFFSLKAMEKLFDLYAEGNGTLLPQEVTSLKTKLLNIKRHQVASRQGGIQPTYNAYMATLKDGRPGGYLDNLPGNCQLDSEEAHNLSIIVAWQLFNIVEGPKESVRTDDPGSDGFDDFQHVDRRKHLPRYTSVFALYNAFKSIKNSFLLSGAKTMANTGGGASDVIIDAWEDEVLRAIHGANWLASKKFIPLMPKYWRQSNKPGKLPKVDGKEFCWVERNQKPAPSTEQAAEVPGALLA